MTNAQEELIKSILAEQHNINVRLDKMATQTHVTFYSFMQLLELFTEFESQLSEYAKASSSINASPAALQLMVNHFRASRLSLFHRFKDRINETLN